MVRQKSPKEKIPKIKDLIEPTFVALKKLGGSGSNKEIVEQIIEDLNIEEEVAEVLKSGSTTKTELENRADWARTYMNKCDVIDRIGKGLWVINTDYTKKETVDASEIFSEYRSITNKKKEKRRSRKNEEIEDNVIKDNDSTSENSELFEDEHWRNQLSDILINMDPYGFERLTQRLLRECGFSDVEVTQSSGDGGIDGVGKLKINGIFSFNIAFQCKRYTNPVGAPQIRDFRGSLSTNIEKGVFITTSRFTREAEKEATSPGKKQIDLIDGEDFVDKLAQYEIGLKPIIVYEIDEKFFKDI